MADSNWMLEIKFHGTSMNLVGRLPAEKRNLLKDLPKKLPMSTRVKLSAIPSKGVFCKFFAKNTEEMKMYMRTNACALCVHFTASVYNFTLYLIVPDFLPPLACLKRLKKSGASAESIKSLCTDRDGVVIGFIVSEVNEELEQKKKEQQQHVEDLQNRIHALENNFNDPMAAFAMALDELETKPAAIQVRTNELFISKKVTNSDKWALGRFALVLFFVIVIFANNFETKFWKSCAK